MAQGVAIVAIIAVGVGLLFSPLSRDYPLFHWLYHLRPELIGLFPATTPLPWRYTFQQLHQVDLRGQSAFVTGEFKSSEAELNLFINNTQSIHQQ